MVGDDDDATEDDDNDECVPVIMALPLFSGTVELTTGTHTVCTIPVLTERAGIFGMWCLLADDDDDDDDDDDNDDDAADDEAVVVEEEAGDAKSGRGEVREGQEGCSTDRGLLLLLEIAALL